jgi:hypothetical protein
MRIAVGIVGALVVVGTVLLAPAPVIFGTDAVSHVYDMPPDQTLQVAGALATTRLNWRVANMDAAAGAVHLIAPSRLGLSADSVLVTVRPKGDDAAVSITSTAGLRGFDFGANAQHVRDLQTAMDGQLPPGK